MAEQIFSARRCRDTRKPRAEQCPDTAFYRCKDCGSLFTLTGEKALEEKEILCCGQPSVRLMPVSAESVKDRLEVSYEIIGGYNDNSVRVQWSGPDRENYPEWVYLKTFTGGYLKYTKDIPRSGVVFALADTDAFAYCDESPCLECVFRCKRGFVVYFFSPGIGLIELALDKMHAQWQTGAEAKQ